MTDKSWLHALRGLPDRGQGRKARGWLAGSRSAAVAMLIALTGPVGSASTAHAGAESPAAPVVRAIEPDALTALLAEAPGKVRVVNFWATWCGPCVAELPVLRRFAESHPDVDVILVNVDLPSLRDRKVVPFLRKHELQGMQHLQLDDPDPAMALLRAVPDWPDSIPVTLIYRGDGERALLLNRGLSADELDRAAAAAKEASRPQ